MRQVYFLAHQGRIKTGYTAKLQRRLREYRQSIGEFEFIGAMAGDRKFERSLHKAFIEYQIKGEWFHDRPELRGIITRMLNSGNPIDIDQSAERDNGSEPPSGWFEKMARELWPDGPAAELHELTGFPPRTCRSAANGHQGVSAAMLYALLRGPQGKRVHDAIMAGCEQPWWIEHQRAAAVGRKVLDITK